MRRGLFLALALTCAEAVSAQDFTTLKGHGGPVMAIDVTPEGQVVTASFDNSVGLWTQRDPQWLEGHEAAVTVVLALPDGRIASGSDDFTVRLWDNVQSRVLGQHQGKVTALARWGDWLASGSWDGSVRLWPLQAGTPRDLPFPGGGVNDLTFGPDGALYVATMTGDLLRYDPQGGAPLTMVRHGFGINELAMGDGWIAYGAVDGGTRVVDAATGEALRDFTLDRRPILAMDHHPQAGLLAVGDGQGYIMMIDTRAWKITRDFRAARQGPVWALAFSPAGDVIHAGGIDDIGYSWPVALLDDFDPAMGQPRSFLRAAEGMSNGERQFMRKCSICHALEPGPSRKAGPTLHGIFGRDAGSLPEYTYSETLTTMRIRWSEQTIDALFDQGPDHYIPGSKMPMQVISGAEDRADLIAFLKAATQ
ncbi:c-type cytochrome [Tropicibacter oceani]|uniref:C-type cytochrome n=1 Tax=Tropicibacter oceani TaxID=3058420 RepID=A0ABY8QLR7_9RHOB|nr:c-type cytochrome [Tropicibacter oceani]WGW05557.1 c-type cytochrome [Tropicibacter oceani]